MRLAIVHDYLNQYGGAERVLEELHRMYPAAPIYTSMYDPARMPTSFQEMDIRTSFMQRLPSVTTHHQAYLPCYPLAFQSFDFAGYDVVLSNSSAWAKGVAPPAEATHVCYCLTPMRWAWRYDAYVKGEGFGRPLKLALRPVMAALRTWDAATARRVQHFIAISREVATRIQRCYGRQATIIYPPVQTSRFATDRLPGDYYLVVSRLIPYKRVDLAIEAFNRLELPLKVAGEGRDRAALKARAGPNVELLGRVSDEQLVDLVQGCRAFLFPGEEDFGIAPVEAQAAGRPVVAFAAGGALDTVVDGETGVLFAEQSVEALVAAVHHLEALDLDARKIAAQAQRFDASVFRREVGAFVEQAAGTG